MGRGKKRQQPTKQQQQQQRRENRQQKTQLKKQRQIAKYGDASWKKEFDRFAAQLKLHDLVIKDVLGDGSCLFRAIADQMEGNPNLHATYRNRICNYMEEHRGDFEFFVEDDVPWDRYMSIMRRDGTWGGQMEIQAASVLLSVNVTIHQVDTPRWEINNFPGARSIHLSYHDGQHYSSVRPSKELMSHRAPSVVEIKSKEPSYPTYGSKESKRGKKKSHNESPVSQEALMISEITACYNFPFISQLLLDNWGDINACVEFIMMVGPTETEFQDQYVRESDVMGGQPAPTTSSPPPPSENSNSNSSDGHSRKGKGKGKGRGKGKWKTSGSEDEAVVESTPSLNPKLAKFNNSHMSNKQRQEMQRKERFEKTLTPAVVAEEPVPENGDPENLVVDLGAMEL